LPREGFRQIVVAAQQPAMLLQRIGRTPRQAGSDTSQTGYMAVWRDRIADHHINRIAELLPWNVANPSPDRAAARTPPIKSNRKSRSRPRRLTAKLAWRCYW
jgi:hypothetical protein